MRLRPHYLPAVRRPAMYVGHRLEGETVEEHIARAVEAYPPPPKKEGAVLMGTRLSQFVMVALPVHWDKDHNDQFYEAMRGAGLWLERWEDSTGKIGLLQDRMGDSYCWFGLVLAHMTVAEYQSGEYPLLDPVTPTMLQAYQQQVSEAYQPHFGVLNAGQEPKLILVNDWG